MRMLYITEEPPITKGDGIMLKGGLFYFIFKFEYRKSRTIKGGTVLKLICATKCSNNHMHPQIHSQDSLHFTLTLAILHGMALPHLKRGTTALEPRHCRDLSDRWGLGVFIPFPFLPNGSLPLLPHFSSSKIERTSLSPSIVDLEPSSKSIYFPVNFLEKRVQNSIREQLH